MTQQEKRPLEIIINELLIELNRLHIEPIDNSAFDNFTGFATSKCGREVIFTKKSISLRNELVSNMLPADKGIFEDCRDITKIVGREEFRGIVRQALADLYADSRGVIEGKECIKKLKNLIRQQLEKEMVEYTFYYPAVTLGMEVEEPLVIGPVTIMSREHWLETVKFPEIRKSNLMVKKGDHLKWKGEVKVLIQNKAEKSWKTEDEDPVCYFARSVYSAIANYKTILKITLLERELKHSQKVGQIICQTT